MFDLSAFSRVNQAYPASRTDSKGISQTCPAPSLDMSDQTQFLSDKVLDRTYPVPKPVSRVVCGTCPTPIPNKSGPRPGHVWVFDTPMARFSWGAIKGPHTSLAWLATHFTLQTLWDTLLSSQPLSSKLPRRDLSLTLEWPTRSSSQALHRQSSCVHYSWGFIPLDWLGCPGVTKVVVDPGKFVLPSTLWGFDSGN
jgi:hypothetical protein